MITTLTPTEQFAHAAQIHLSILLCNDLITEQEYNERAQMIREVTSWN